jgi:hypothetical protein
MRRIQCIVLVLLVGGGAACSETTKNTPAKVQPKTGIKSTQLVTKEGDPIGDTTEVTATIPEDLPKDVPVYPGVKVFNAGSAAGTTFIAMESLAGAEQVTQFYKDSFAKSGWKTETKSGSPRMGPLVMKTHQLTATKDQRTCFVTIMDDPNEGKTKITLQHETAEIPK